MVGVFELDLDVLELQLEDLLFTRNIEYLTPVVAFALS